MRQVPRGSGCRLRESLVVLLVALAAGGGCSEVRGRRLIQEANEQYRRGKFDEAVALFTRAEPLVPELPVLWLNKGYTCRQLIVPALSGASLSPESRRAADCALAAFDKLKALRPADPRGDQLYVQTLYDANDLPALERLFLERNRQQPNDIDVIAGLQQVTYKVGRWQQALAWSRKAAALRPADPQAQYSIGTFVWQVLSSRGGGNAMATFDPRPRPAPADEEADEPPATKKKPKRDLPPPMVVPAPPPTAPLDITGALRVQLADEGISYLEKALALRPHYGEAMTYVGLLYRQKSFAYFAEPAQWQSAVDKADEWQRKALAARAESLAPGRRP